jgi:hypothetical protein
MSLFSSGIVIIVAVRIGILTERARDILQNSSKRQSTIDHLHNVYFGTIALVECTSAFFLLRKLALAHKTSIEAASSSRLFAYLMRSTEIRVANDGINQVFPFYNIFVSDDSTVGNDDSRSAGQFCHYVGMFIP